MPSWFKKTFGFDPLQPVKEVYEHGKEEIGRFVGDIGQQIDRSTQDISDVTRWTVAAPITWMYQTQKTAKHRAADYQAQQAAQSRELAQYMANINRERADYSIIDSIMRSRRMVAMRSRQSRGILTSPLGAPMDQNKKMLLGQ